MKDDDLFKEILAAREREWCIDRYRSRVHEKCPKSALRRLSEQMLIEVETRRCTTWNFGGGYPKYPCIVGRRDQDEVTLAQYRVECNEWNETQKQRGWQDRTVVVAQVTPAGLAYAAEQGFL